MKINIRAVESVLNLSTQLLQRYAVKDREAYLYLRASHNNPRCHQPLSVQTLKSQRLDRDAVCKAAYTAEGACIASCSSSSITESVLSITCPIVALPPAIASNSSSLNRLINGCNGESAMW